MLKYFKGSLSLFSATTRSHSRRLFFFKYRLVKYLRYRLERAISLLTTKLPTLPSTLMCSVKYWLKLAMSRMPSSTGAWQLMVNFRVLFFDFLLLLVGAILHVCAFL